MATRTSAASGGFRADDADTWGLGSGVYPATTDDIIIAAGHNITLKEDNEVAYFQQQGGSGTESTLTLASHTLTINSRNSSNSRVIDVGNEHCNIADNTGTIKLAGTADAAHKLMGLNHWADELQNLTIHTSGSNPTYRQESALTVNGNLTITAGALTTNTSNHALTVTGDAIIDGTLTGNNSVVRLGSLAVGGTYSASSNETIITSERSNGRAVDIVGTFTHNSGTIEIQTAADTDLRWPSSSSAYHININHASCIARPTGSNKPPIAGNLYIKQGKFSLLDSDGSTTHPCTVTGSCTIGDGSGSANTAIFEGRDDSVTFGSLTIDSDGQYDATSGTTTLTTAGASGTRSFYNNGGTFTHNNGTIKIDTGANTNYDFDGDDLYNFTVECEDTNGALQCDGQASTPVTVLNNLDIKMGILRTNGNTFTVHGNVYVRATSKTNKNKFVGQQVTQNVYGLITVEDGAFYDLANQGSGSYGTLNAGGIRIL